jgi:hypothetical protein
MSEQHTLDHSCPLCEGTCIALLDTTPDAIAILQQAVDWWSVQFERDDFAPPEWVISARVFITTHTGRPS